MAHLSEIEQPENGWSDVPEFGERSMTYGRHGKQIVPWGPIDQREQDWLSGYDETGNKLAMRPDVLAFESSPLRENTEITGQVIVNLWISSSATDTDFTAKLIDSYPPTVTTPKATT